MQQVTTLCAGAERKTRRARPEENENLLLTTSRFMNVQCAHATASALELGGGKGERKKAKGETGLKTWMPVDLDEGLCLNEIPTSDRRHKMKIFAHDSLVMGNLPEL